MEINEKDIIILDDNNQYVVVKIINLEKIKYYYIIDINDLTNIKYLYEDGNELVEIEDENVIQNIIKIITEQTNVENLLQEAKSILKKMNENV